jgi:predicted phosphoribosyltransferase
LPLDVVVVRKVGAPGQPELAMGAVASGGARVVNDDVLAHFADAEAVFAAMAEREHLEVVRREALFRAGEARSTSRIASASSSTTGSRPVRPWRRPCVHCGCWAQRA